VKTQREKVEAVVAAIEDHIKPAARHHHRGGARTMTGKARTSTVSGTRVWVCAAYACAVLTVLCAVADLVAAIVGRSFFLAIYVITFAGLAYAFRILGEGFAEMHESEQRITDRDSK